MGSKRGAKLLETVKRLRLRSEVSSIHARKRAGTDRLCKNRTNENKSNYARQGWQAKAGALG